MAVVGADAVTNDAAGKQVELEVADFDASKVKITLSKTLKDIPRPETLSFGQTMTDHMLISTFHPVAGWSAPEIKPYGPLSLDPASSCFQYSTNVFEGMKAYIGPDGKPRLFRPNLNMARMRRSAGRVALPPFNTDELLKAIKKLVAIESRWIPNQKGYSLYVRPTIIGSRASLNVGPSDHAILYVICSPVGPYFRTGPKPVSLLAVDEHVRAWPGGTGSYKLALNYAPTLMPQQLAAKKGYDQCLWLLGEEKKVTEVGAMNFFIVLKRDDGDLDVITPPLNGTILPGVTRDSTLALAAAHPSRIVLPGLPDKTKLHARERELTMPQIAKWAEEGRLLESFGVGTAAVVAPIGRIGFDGKDIALPLYEGGALGPVARALYQQITEIQEGKVEWEGWSVVCD